MNINSLEKHRPSCKDGSVVSTGKQRETASVVSASQHSMPKWASETESTRYLSVCGFWTWKQTGAVVLAWAFSLRLLPSVNCQPCWSPPRPHQLEGISKVTHWHDQWVCPGYPQGTSMSFHVDREFVQHPWHIAAGFSPEQVVLETPIWNPQWIVIVDI